ncbi:hypothetical protein WMF11_32070 [Sorangium sp. So ce295]|uniref:hypothetical protein n=1 Tax=Sorangium sp. So ce295 TaxID=3133295 RepID=UPI003F601EE2
MDEAGGSTSVNGWFIAGVVALVVGVGCFLVLAWRMRKRKNAGDQAPALARTWQRAVAAMAPSERDGPVIVVLGERLSGKSSLIRGALRGTDRYEGGPDLGVYAGEGQRVQEISGDLLLDPREETEDALRKLWKGIALSAVRAVLVVNARSVTWNDAGLRDLGRVARRKLDLLAELRGSPVHARVAVTHLDERSAGFAPLCEVLQGTGERRPIPHDAADTTIAAWRRVAPRGAATRALPAVVDFVASEGASAPAGGSTLRALSPFFEALLAPARSAPIVDGVFLCAAPPDEPFCATGDALAPDEELAERDARARLVRLLRRAALAAGALALAGGLVFAAQEEKVSETDQAVVVLERAAKKGAPVTRDAEANAAREVLDLQRDGVLFPEKRADVEHRYVRAVQDLKLLPELRSTDRAARIRALAVLDARPGDPLYEAILKEKAQWAKALGVLPETLDAYLQASDGAGPSDEELAQLPPIAPTALGSSLDDWQGYFERLTSVLQGKRLDEGTLAGLQKDARELSRAVDDAAAQTELAEIARLLQQRHARHKDLFGPGTTTGAGPWMQDNASSLRPLLEAVLAASLDGPSGAGKGLREAVSDLPIVSVPPVFVAEEAPATEPAPAEPRSSWLDRIRKLAAPAASAAPSALPAARPSAASSSSASPSPAAPSAPAASSSSASAASPSASAGAPAPEQPPANPVYRITLQSKRWTFDTALWSKAIVAGRALRYLDALFADAAARSVLFPKGARFEPVLPSPGRGAAQFIDGQYTPEAFRAEVSPGLQGFERALEPTGLSSHEREAYLRVALKAAEDHARGLRGTLDAYAQSFQLSPGGAAALAADVADMVSPASFMTDFLTRTADLATMPASPSALLRPIADKVADYGPIVRLMQGEKGKYPALEPYYKLLIPLIPSLVDQAPPSPPKDAALDARLAPIGALAYAALRDPAKSIHAQVEAWLNDAALPESLRRPFRLVPQRALGLGKADLDRAVAEAYDRALRPVVSPLLSRFPFDSRSEFDARAADVEAVFGPKGTFYTAFAALVGPVCHEGPPGTFTPLEVPTAGAVRIPPAALRLASWSADLTQLLFSADGKPRPIALSVKAPALSPVERERTVTFALLLAGTSSFYAFNQTPSWQSFPVVWSPGDAGAGRASVGIQTMETGGGAPRVQTQDAPPSDFAFFRLLQRRADTEAKGPCVTWEFPAELPGGPKRYAAFLFDPSPIGLLRAPSLE